MNPRLLKQEESSRKGEVESIDEDVLILSEIEADLLEEDDDSFASDSQFSFISDSSCHFEDELIDFKGLFSSTNNAVQDPGCHPRENVKPIMGEVLSCFTSSFLKRSLS